MGRTMRPKPCAVKGRTSEVDWRKSIGEKVHDQAGLHINNHRLHSAPDYWALMAVRRSIAVRN